MCHKTFYSSTLVAGYKFSPFSSAHVSPVTFASLRIVLAKNATVSVTEFVLEMERVYRMNIETAARDESFAANENFNVS